MRIEDLVTIDRLELRERQVELRVRGDKTINLIHRLRVKIRCKMDLRMFPHDQQVRGLLLSVALSKSWTSFFRLVSLHSDCQRVKAHLPYNCFAQVFLFNLTKSLTSSLRFLLILGTQTMNSLIRLLDSAWFSKGKLYSTFSTNTSRQVLLIRFSFQIISKP